MVQKCTNTIETGKGMQIHQAHLNGFESIFDAKIYKYPKNTQRLHTFLIMHYITAMGWKGFCTSLSSYNSYWQDGTGYLHPLKDNSWATWPLVEEWLDSMLVSTLNQDQNYIVPKSWK